VSVWCGVEDCVCVCVVWCGGLCVCLCGVVWSTVWCNVVWSTASVCVGVCYLD
jgi:hypothetical protein